MVGDDFSKYEAMRRSGSSAEDIYRVAVQDGVDPITRIRLLRSVFSIGLAEAKEGMVRGEGWANSLDEYQEGLAEELEEEDSGS